MSLVYAILAVLVFLVPALLVFRLYPRWASKQSTTPPMNKPLNPSTSDEPKLGTTRVRVVTYGDGRKIYQPEILCTKYSIHRDQEENRWVSLPTDKWDYNFGDFVRVEPQDTLHAAEVEIDKYLDRIKAQTVVKTEYIKYP